MKHARATEFMLYVNKVFSSSLLRNSCQYMLNTIIDSCDIIFCVKCEVEFTLQPVNFLKISVPDEWTFFFFVFFVFLFFFFFSSEISR